ncbi:hypothetical protein Q3A66_07125 [Hymenobacter sp. BT770]|uniref:hypothetical protein n=1 Tax=Hymenobacter sp. BT770 TaxID=2886942 RepID=UPI001D108F87|nr:hypothetical protein [Hymenobacter sp. BT770]MCC3152761.1 hypothetical protein [Hymenobacter sp. BT770]MDO3414836.1 hypothetical protein [Hymenobacter sp. BT770]
MTEQALADSLAFAHRTQEEGDDGRLLIRAKYKNLRITYWPDQHRGLIRGSLHRFAHGSNGSHFPAADVARACAELAAALALPPAALVVSRLEVGVNLEVPTPPRKFMELLDHHKRSPFAAMAPPAGVSRPLGYVAGHADYKVKVYDKAAHLAQQKKPLPKGHHLLRYEVAFTRAREALKITGRTQLTLADLPDSGVMGAFAVHLQKQWGLIARRMDFDYAGLSMADAELLRAGADTKFWEGTRDTTPPSTYKKHKARYRKLQQQAAHRAGPHPYDLLLPKQLETLLQLSNPGCARPESGPFLHACNQLENRAQNNEQPGVMSMPTVPMLMAA